MENHPIPQDVTGFQFKLIGNMTVKQFAYLATGLVFAWILLQLPVSLLIKFPFCAISAILGIGLAYIPVSGRPMDLMIGNYVKALFRPTQFVYDKAGGQLYFPGQTPILAPASIKQYKNSYNPLPQNKLKAYLESMNTQPKSRLDEKENNFLMSVSTLTAGSISSQPAVSPSPNVALQPDLQLQPAEYSQPQRPLTSQSLTTPAMPEPIKAVSQAIPDAQSTPAPTQRAAAAPTIATSAPAQPAKPIRSAFTNFNKTIGTPVAPEFPNLITGITRDARGNALSNILIEIRDRDGNPVRAFKTNELGRFASATPLTNGQYSIEFEDPKAQNKFERITISVAGQIIQPLVAVSVDTREELRRSLFATGNQAN